MNFSTDYIFTFWAINTVWYIYNSTNVLLKNNIKILNDIKIVFSKSGFVQVVIFTNNLWYKHNQLKFSYSRNPFHIFSIASVQNSNDKSWQNQNSNMELAFVKMICIHGIIRITNNISYLYIKQLRELLGKKKQIFKSSNQVAFL